MTTANENTENTDRENADRDPEANADPEANPGPTPDFSTLRSAAMTYRMFGATPVPLLNTEDANTEDISSKGKEQSGFKAESLPSQSVSDQTGGEADWENADGIGILAGKRTWNGLVVQGNELDSSLFNLRMRGSAWVARNNRSALIYFRTDASRDILRAVAAIYQAAMSPRFTAAACAGRFGGPNGPVVLPVPPSPDLAGGRWEFLGDRPEEPPPFRSFQVGTEVISETRIEEVSEESKAIPNRGIPRNHNRQALQSRRQSK